MKKKMKRLLSLCLALTMVLGMVPASAAGPDTSGSAVEVTPVEAPPLEVTNEIVIGNLIDFHLMTPGQVKYQIASINPQGAKLTVTSSNPDVAVAEMVPTPEHITGNQDLTCTANTPNERDDVREIKVTANTPGTATITVTATADGYDETSVTFEVNVLESVNEGTQRKDVSIDKGWNFALAKDLPADFTPEKLSDPNCDLSTFAAVDLPHTWNIHDVENELTKHYGVGYYRKEMFFSSEEYADKAIFIDFGAANKVSDLYINGEHVGTHKGGYARFRYDITDKVKLDENNIIVMKVDNSVGGTVMPLSGGFAYHGSIYRDSYVTATDPVAFDKLDYGSSAVYLTQTNVSKESADLNVKAKLHNYGDSEQTVQVKAVLYEEDGRTQVTTLEDTLTLGIGEDKEFSKDYTLNDPHLWNGRIDPYQYVVEVTIEQEGAVLERVRERIGFRFFEVLGVDDPRADEGAFLLNGEHYLLAGVAQHQDRENMGNAITHKEMDEDIAFVSEIGATCLRLSHYQHDRYMYDLASERGIVTWAEIPNVNTVGGKNTEFLDNAKQQLTELIRQNYNATGILMWGIHNEQWPHSDMWVNEVLDELYNLGKQEDPTRYITVATAQSQSTPLSWQSDISAWNKYFGWYEGANIDGFGPWVDKVKEFAINNDTVTYTGEGGTFTTEVNKTIGMSEYGSGNNIWTHEINPPDHVASIKGYQSEEYVNKYHESHWQQIRERPWIWGTFIWNMFDFAQPGVTSEGGIVSRNTKGLMSFDRSLKKDQFYFYKVNWSDEPTVYISSRRFDKHYEDENYVRVYSNMDEVELFVNGVSAGVIKRTDPALPNTEAGNLIRDPSLGIFHFEGDVVTLPQFGDYEITAVGRMYGEDDTVVNEYRDTITISRLKDYRTELSSKTYIIDNTNKTISKVSYGTTVEEFLPNVEVLYNGTMRIIDEDGKDITDDPAAVITLDTTVKVTSEDGENEAVYTVEDTPISVDAAAKASSSKSGHDAKCVTDSRLDTYWNAADGTYPQYFEIDLGEETNLYKFSTLFYGAAPRSYQYKISVSNDGSNYRQVVDRTKNTESAWVMDDLDEPVSARYIRLEFTGVKNGSNAAAHEFMAYGFRVASRRYTVENGTREVCGVAPTTTVEDLLSNLSVTGNYVGMGVQDAEGQPLTGDTPVGEGAELWVSIEDGSIVTYQIKKDAATDVPVSQNKPISDVFDVKSGSSASYVNDGNLDTFWNASTGFDPARYVVIDLGAPYYLTQSNVDFYQSSSERYYRYRISGSLDGEEFTELVDGTGNTDKESVSHVLGVPVRYLKLEVTGTSVANVNFAAAVRELRAYGWTMSGSYPVDHVEKTISGVVDMTPTDTFMQNLDLRGNFTATLMQDGQAVPEAEFIRDGMTLRVMDLDGKNAVDYAIVTGMDMTPISRNKPVSGECKAGSDPAFAVDGDPETFWNGPMKDSNTATYPASLLIDLAEDETVNGKKIEYNLTKVVTNWYEKNGRTYQFEYTVLPALGLPIVWHDGKDNQTNGIVEVTNETNNGSDTKVSEFRIDVIDRTPAESYLAAAIREVDVYGWYLGSEVYTVEDTSITGVPAGTDVDTFRKDLDIRGNFLYQLVDENGEPVTDGEVTSGMQVVITDIEGKEFKFVITVGEAPVTYTVTVETEGEGTVSAEPKQAKEGDTVTLTAAPAEGWNFVEWKSEDVEVTEDGTFTMPGKDVTVTAVFEEGATDVKVESITVSAPTDKITEKGGTLQMVATVLPENATDKTVTWTVTSEDGSETQLATIDQTGLLTAAEEEGTVKVTATANDGSGVTDEKIITINFADEPVVTGVTVSPATASVQVGTTRQFTAVVTGENEPDQAVTWSVEDAQSETTTISDDGLLTVAEDETAETLTVTATSVANEEISGTATVTVTAAPVETYTLTVNGGTGSGEYEAGAQITVTADAPEAGMQFVNWTAEGVELEDDTATTLTITMPANAVTLTANYEAIPVTNVTGVKLNVESVYLYSNFGPRGEQLIATVEPADADDKSVTWTSADENVVTVNDVGYLTVVGEGMTTVTVTTNDGGYTAQCLVQVGSYNDGSDSGEDENTTPPTETEEPGETTEPEQPGETTEPGEPETPAFSDVPATHWASEAVDYVVSEGLFNGTSDTTFSPDASMTRAMFFTVLARLDGVDTTGGATWYEKAMAWAVAEGITDGTNPEATITREQLAVMLYRYAGSPATEGSLTGFADAASVSSWAQDAMEWAVAEGILTGKNGSALDPQGTASRAEVATMLMRFVQGQSN
ncbi:discoidin domain-containing protein [Flavonifractor hominis]|uniref:Discoidin domain-containing protein n=1 Tax=Flavonifractor hominis TaxID=3133178 RepID=A0ABV1EPE0_9FIRM